MDPQATIEIIKKLVTKSDTARDPAECAELYSELADVVGDLKDWRDNGGFMPKHAHNWLKHATEAKIQLLGRF